jgi:hypothetical protein
LIEVINQAGYQRANPDNGEKADKKQGEQSPAGTIRVSILLVFDSTRGFYRIALLSRNPCLRKIA